SFKRFWSAPNKVRRSEGAADRYHCCTCRWKYCQNRRQKREKRRGVLSFPNFFWVVWGICIYFKRYLPFTFLTPAYADFCHNRDFSRSTPKDNAGDYGQALQPAIDAAANCEQRCCLRSTSHGDGVRHLFSTEIARRAGSVCRGR